VSDDLEKLLLDLGWEAGEEHDMSVGELDDDPEDFDEISEQTFSLGPYDATLRSGITWNSIQITNEETGTTILEYLDPSDQDVEKFKAKLRQLTETVK